MDLRIGREAAFEFVEQFQAGGGIFCDLATRNVLVNQTARCHHMNANWPTKNVSVSFVIAFALT